MQSTNTFCHQLKTVSIPVCIRTLGNKLIIVSVGIAAGAQDKQICWTSLHSPQNLRGPHAVGQQQQLSIDICCLRPTSAANPPLLLSIDGTDGRTDARLFYEAYRILCRPRDKLIRGVVVRERGGTPFQQIFLSRNGAPVDIVGHRWNANIEAFRQITPYSLG